MEQEKQSKKQKKGILLFGFLLLVAILLVGSGMMKQGNTQADEVQLLDTLITHEVHMELSTTPSDYLEGVDDNKPFAFDFSQVDVRTLGTYDAQLTYNGANHAFRVEVVDTTNPILSLQVEQPLVVSLDTTLEELVEKLISIVEVSDNYDEGLVLDEISLQQLSIPEVAGQFAFELTATDSSGNIGRCEVVVEFQQQETPEDETVEKPDSDTTNQNETSKPSTIKVTSIALSLNQLSLEVGKSTKVTATVAPSNASNKSVTFASENNAIASVDANGSITAKTAGTTKIIVSAVGNTAVKAYVTVNVKAVTVTPSVVVPTSISVNKSSVSIEVNQSTSLSATVAPITATDKSVTYASENNAIATVNASGTITAKAAGTTRIVVSAKGNTSVKAYVNVTVTNPPVTPSPTPPVEEEVKHNWVPQYQIIAAKPEEGYWKIVKEARYEPMFVISQGSSCSYSGQIFYDVYTVETFVAKNPGCSWYATDNPDKLIEPEVKEWVVTSPAVPEQKIYIGDKCSIHGEIRPKSVDE